jgi:hypothetical protein
MRDADRFRLRWGPYRWRDTAGALQRIRLYRVECVARRGIALQLASHLSLGWSGRISYRDK